MGNTLAHIIGTPVVGWGEGEGGRGRGRGARVSTLVPIFVEKPRSGVGRANEKATYRYKRPPLYNSQSIVYKRGKK